MDTTWVWPSMKRMGPELVLVGTILLVILADLTRKLKGRPVVAISVLGVLGSLGVLWQTWTVAAPPMSTFLGAYAFDHYALFFKAAFLVATLIVILFSEPVIRKWETGQGEFFALMLSCTFGMCLMAGANDLLMMYLALEFVSVTSYIMAGFHRRNRRSAEASLKYILYGAAASGVMIYGMTFLYGVSGTLNVPELASRLGALDPQPGQTFFLITSVLIMAGFAYKIAAVPFHMWCPDVYEGAPTPVTAFFSVGPKVAGFAMLARFLMGVFGTDPDKYPFEWTLVIALLCVMTIVLGNLAALHQQNLKRLFAYSSIAHAGYILIAFTLFTPNNVASMMFYVVAYVAMNLGAFLVVIVLEEQFGVETVDDCRGMGWRSPMLCGLMAVFLISLTGLPPTGGFWGKVYVFAEVLRNGDKLHYTLVVVAVVFTVVSLYYYMRILSAMFLSPPADSEKEVPIHPTFAVLLWVLAIATIVLGIFPDTLMEVARTSSRHFLGLQ